jgi:hypothetical protein
MTCLTGVQFSAYAAENTNSTVAASLSACQQLCAKQVYPISTVSCSVITYIPSNSSCILMASSDSSSDIMYNNTLATTCSQPGMCNVLCAPAVMYFDHAILSQPSTFQLPSRLHANERARTTSNVLFRTTMYSPPALTASRARVRVVSTNTTYFHRSWHLGSHYSKTYFVYIGTF